MMSSLGLFRHMWYSIRDGTKRKGVWQHFRPLLGDTTLTPVADLVVFWIYIAL